MNKRTKATSIDNKTRRIVKERDMGCCIFCRQLYHMPESVEYGTMILDIMHYVPRSAGGMGIPENLAIGCRYHHDLLDNGNKGLRPEMLEIFEAYLRSIYKDWEKDALIYTKFKNLA